MVVGGGGGFVGVCPTEWVKTDSSDDFANQSSSTYDLFIRTLTSHAVPLTCPSCLFPAPAQIVCRSTNQLAESTKQKISNFCHVPSENVISVPDCSSIYRVPLLLEQQGVLRFLHRRLSLPDSVSPPSLLLRKWKNLSDR